MSETRISCFWRSPELARDVLTGVSLHSHTNRSRESLYFLPQLARKCPGLYGALEKKCATVRGGVDFTRAYWTPPLNPRLSYELEKNQIEKTLALQSLVSLTDHDNIEAAGMLRTVPETADVPLSLEWSVPFAGTIFHVGVHNLPPARAQAIVAELTEYRRSPSDKRLAELMSMLDEIPETLIVLNHPMWDQRENGKPRDPKALDRFLKENARFLHAIEFNATRRTWENKTAREIAERYQLPLVGGGDRHGCEPSGALNLTRAQSFEEFVQEIRCEKRSHVLVMPQYTTPLSLRTARTLLDVIREYPEFPEGSQRWDDRVFYAEAHSGSEIRAVSSLWNAPPAFVERIFSVVRLVENGAVQRAWEFLFGGLTATAAPSEGSSEASS